MSVVDVLRRARAVSRLSLRRFGVATGIAAPNLSAVETGRRDPTASTVDRIAAALGITFVPAVLEGRSTVAETSVHIASALARDDSAGAYRLLIQIADDLAAPDPVTRVLLAAEPPPMFVSEWDALVAGLVEWRLTEVLAPVPSWAKERPGDPSWAWVPESTLVPPRLDHVAEPLRRRGVLIEADELESV